MAKPKGERHLSKDEFDAIYYRIHDDAIDMVNHNFRAKPEAVADKQVYVQSASKKLFGFVWDLINHIKIANNLYPTTHEELVERRLEQDRALGSCFSMLTLYELVMKYLKVKDDMGVTEIQNINHGINAIKAWRNTITADCNACRKTIQSIDGLYEELFPIHEQHIREKRQDVLRKIWEENINEIRRCKRNGTFSD